MSQSSPDKPRKLKAFTAQAYDSDLATLELTMTKYWGLRTKIFTVIVRDLAKAMATNPEATIQTFLAEYHRGQNSPNSVIKTRLTQSALEKHKARRG